MNSIDQNLVEELKKGSYFAFNNLFAKYGKPLFGFIYSILKNVEDSKEIVQDVFVKVWERRQSLNEYSSFKSFLFSIAYHQVISEFRKNASKDKYIEYIDLKSPESPNTPDLEVEYRMLYEKIDQIVDAMPPQRKTIFKLSRYEGLSHSEIAARLNLSIKTVENHLGLSLKTLRAELDDYLLIALLLAIPF